MEKFEWVSGWRLMELLWPLKDMFRARLHEIRDLPYDVTFGPEADAAIRAFAAQPDAGAWSTLSLGAWRVLLERHQQLMIRAGVNDLAGNPVTSVPAGFSALSEADQRIRLMLLLLLEMKLPFPSSDQSRLEFPQPPSARGH